MPARYSRHPSWVRFSAHLTAGGAIDGIVEVPVQDGQFPDLHRSRGRRRPVRQMHGRQARFTTQISCANLLVASSKLPGQRLAKSPKVDVGLAHPHSAADRPSRSARRRAIVRRAVWAEDQPAMGVPHVGPRGDVPSPVPRRGTAPHRRGTGPTDASPVTVPKRPPPTRWR